MLSRVAESLYWMARNVERAESIARILDTNHNRTIENFATAPERSAVLWYSVLNTMGMQPAEPLANGSSHGIAAAALEYAAFSSRNPSSIVSCVRLARQNAVGVRADLSTEIWEALNGLYLYVQTESAHTIAVDGPSNFLRRIRDTGQAFGGVVDATITHADEWLFLQLGRYMERAWLTARILANHDPLDESTPEWQRLLEMACASEPFAKAHRSAAYTTDESSFLLLDELFPRSVRFCTRRIGATLRRLSDTREGSYANEAERIIGRLQATLDYSAANEIAEVGGTGFAIRCVEWLEGVHDAVARSLFPRIPAA
jgi:uncharacterized alpha-E superfamily protein